MTNASEAGRDLQAGSHVHGDDRPRRHAGCRVQRQDAAQAAVAAAVAGQGDGREIQRQRAGGAEHVEQGRVHAAVAEEKELTRVQVDH